MFNVNINEDNYELDNETAEFLNKLKIDYNKFYRGIVVDNADPELRGRIKVRIPQIYGADTTTSYYVPTSSIPWAICAICPASNDGGTFLPPNIGDTVFVAFEGGSKNNPMYFGGIYKNYTPEDNRGVGSRGIYNGVPVQVNSDDLPGEVVRGTERIIYKSLKGATIYIDERDGAECVKIIDQSGQSIIMENLSNETLRRRGVDVGKNPRSQIVLTNNSGDSITLAQGKIHLKSENIILETDNFEQIGISDYTDEINMADIILGGEQDD